MIDAEEADYYSVSMGPKWLKSVHNVSAVQLGEL
jgi:hypothetical protein